jgi:hypothetical protein
VCPGSNSTSSSTSVSGAEIVAQHGTEQAEPLHVVLLAERGDLIQIDRYG